MPGSRAPLTRRAFLAAMALAALPGCGSLPGARPSASPGQPEGKPAERGSPANGASATSSPYAALANTKGEITFWHFWASPVRRNAIRRVMAGFAQQYADVKVADVVIPFAEIWPKAIAAVAAGSGMPDVLVEDRIKLRDRARQNVDVSLGDYARRDKVGGEAFWPFTWEESTVNGVPYGLPFETDIRVLFYNRAALKDAGLDPAKPPASWDELWLSAAPLDRFAGDRTLQRAAFHPLFGNMSLAQWAWNNGGEWQDEQGNPTINAGPNVAALEWIKKWVDRYGQANWAAFEAGFGEGAQDGFMSGKVVMKVDIAGYASFLNFYNPSFVTQDRVREGWGVALIPPAAGQKPASLSGGFALAIPRGSRQADAAWEFIKYAVFVGQSSWARDTYSMPTIQELARSDPVLKADPNWEFFVSAMAYGHPGTFNERYPDMLELLTPATEAVLSGAATAQQALDEAQKRAEAVIAVRSK